MGRNDDLARRLHTPEKVRESKQIDRIETLQGVIQRDDLQRKRRNCQRRANVDPFLPTEF